MEELTEGFSGKSSDFILYSLKAGTRTSDSCLFVQF